MPHKLDECVLVIKETSLKSPRFSKILCVCVFFLIFLVREDENIGNFIQSISKLRKTPQKRGKTMNLNILF